MKADINLKNSINTNTHAEDVRAFADGAAPALQNTGIERDGGVTNLYETKTDYGTAGDHFITEDGNVLRSVVSGDQRLISVDGRQIGIASAYGVSVRQAIQGVDDACITTTGTYLTAAVKGSGIEVAEYSTAGILLNSRTTTFTNLAAVLQFFTSLSIVRYQGIKYADSLEFALRLGDQIIILKEATPAQTIMSGVSNGNILGTQARIAIVYGSYLVIVGDGGKVASFDGSSWRYPDGTGTGSGPFNDGAAIGGANIYAAEIVPEGGADYLVLAGVSGYVCSFSAGNWNYYNKAGTGLWNNATVIGGNTIYALRTFLSVSGVRYLVVAGDGGRMGSYSVGGWVVYGAGAGLCNNATLLGANSIRTINHILTGGGESVVVFAGVGGRIGSKRFTGGAWNTRVYTDASGVDNPTDNATVCGATDIVYAINWASNDIIFCGATGNIGHWHNYLWYLFGGAGGVGVCINAGTALGGLGAGSVKGLVVFGAAVVVVGNNATVSRAASWDGANWKNYDGTGTGTSIYSTNSDWVSSAFTNLYFGCCIYNGVFVVLYNNGTNSGVNSITAANIKIQMYTPNAGFYNIGSLLAKSYFSAAPATANAYLYVYRYENGLYLINLVGATAWILNNSTFLAYFAYAKYAIPQKANGYTRHILSSDMVLSFLTTKCDPLGYIGYNDFTATFSSTPVFPSNGLYAGSNITIEKYSLGFGYADCVAYTAGAPTSRWNVIPQHIQVQSNITYVFQSQNKLGLVNSYGKITNAYGLAPSRPLEFRVGVINGVMSFLSAAVLDGLGKDCMGSLLTNVGEFDQTYTPDFQDDRILYRYNGVFYYVILSKTLAGKVFQKISEKVYKINTISPLNILSMVDQRLHVGSSDYHGQMIFESTAAPSATATNVASVLAGAITADPLAENIYSNSIDVGDKLCYITAPTSANISLVGYRIPYGWQSIQEMISTYIADIYAFSTANDGSELVLVDPNNPVYVADTRLPVAIGLEYLNGTASNGQTTLFLRDDYDGYVIGNEAKGSYASFQLYGTDYLFDGVTIYQANMQNGIYGGKTAIAPALGMSFIAATPTQAYFLSAFDNSVYIFTGGRNLSKFQRLTQLPAVIRGIYSTRDNALLLDTATSFIWVRDEIVTQNLKSAAQTAIKLYDTTGGIYIGNDSSNWRYGYSPLGGSTVVPLIWQSSYFGQTSNQKANVSAFNARIYSPGKTAQLITGRVDSFDEKAHYAQTVQWDIKKADYSSAGYYQLRTRPMTQKALGTSLTLTIPAKSVLVDLVAEYDDDANAITPGKASR